MNDLDVYKRQGYAPPATEDVLAQMGKDQKKAQQVHNALIGAGTLVRMDAQICFARQHYDEAVSYTHLRKESWLTTMW